MRSQGVVIDVRDGGTVQVVVVGTGAQVYNRQFFLMMHISAVRYAGALNESNERLLFTETSAKERVHSHQIQNSNDEPCS